MKMNKLLIAFSLVVAATFFGAQPLKAQTHDFEKANLGEFATLFPYCQTPYGTYLLGPGYWPAGAGCWVEPNPPFIYYGTVVWF
jgi:hypothetical protein